MRNILAAAAALGSAEQLPEREWFMELLIELQIKWGFPYAALMKRKAGGR
jgi:hypothetical protein